MNIEVQNTEGINKEESSLQKKIQEYKPANPEKIKNKFMESYKEKMLKFYPNPVGENGPIYVMYDLFNYSNYLELKTGNNYVGDVNDEDPSQEGTQFTYSPGDIEQVPLSDLLESTAKIYNTLGQEVGCDVEFAGDVTNTDAGYFMKVIPHGVESGIYILTVILPDGGVVSQKITIQKGIAPTSPAPSSPFGGGGSVIQIVTGDE